MGLRVGAGLAVGGTAVEVLASKCRLGQWWREGVCVRARREGPGLAEGQVAIPCCSAVHQVALMASHCMKTA